MNTNKMLKKMLGGSNKKNSFSMPKMNMKKFGINRPNKRNDWDMDGVTNRKDCQPRNPMRQDTQIYLSKFKKQQAPLAYTYGKDNVFIGDTSRVKNEEIEKHSADIIAHEELHKTIYDTAGERASAQLDNIQGTDVYYGEEGNQTLINPKTSKQIFTSKQTMQKEVMNEANEYLDENKEEQEEE